MGLGPPPHPPKKLTRNTLGTDREYSPGGTFWACGTQIEGVGWPASFTYSRMHVGLHIQRFLLGYEKSDMKNNIGYENHRI